MIEIGENKWINPRHVASMEVVTNDEGQTAVVDSKIVWLAKPIEYLVIHMQDKRVFQCRSGQVDITAIRKAVLNERA